MELKSADREEEFKTVFEDNGDIKFVKKSDKDRGKKGRAGGGQFELRVRKDLEGKGWIVDKWSNNLDLEEGKIVPAKRRTIPFQNNPFVQRISTIGTGFPDFVCFQLMKGGQYKVIGVEVKMNGNLSRVEKEKCVWYLDRKIFSEILVASKVQEKKGRKIRVEYVDFLEIGERMRRGG